MLQIMLEKFGYEVVTAQDGKQGLNAYHTHGADLVITDLIMPEMEGSETIRALRQLSTTVPIIAMSGGGRGTSDNYLTVAKHFGVSMVLPKPFEIDTLCAAVASLLGGTGGTQPKA